MCEFCHLCEANEKKRCRRAIKAPSSCLPQNASQLRKELPLTPFNTDRWADSWEQDGEQLQKFPIQSLSSPWNKMEERGEFSEVDCRRHLILAPSPAMQPQEMAISQPSSAPAPSTPQLPSMGSKEMAISQPPSEPAAGTPQLPSMGSKGHFTGQCKPCAFLHKKDKACQNGAMCEFCHLCEADEKKRRRKAKVITALSRLRV
eukprot:TRINITY_DN7725_c0_g1_i3.p1 TRINITY_DN7725_c0_g1~~TRINITY_DN7725_c0_g1_i3.p1  ORF type:complete len:216 (-),score=40.09 TRINITY_DN7725_c0_g1_i3:63-671(-)